MSLVTNLQNLATRAGTESKSLRVLINGNVADLSALNTTAKNNLVAAINEVFAALGAAGATNLDQLTDVVITDPGVGHVLRHNGTNFVNVLGTTFFDAAGAAAAAQAGAQAASQPLDADLTAIAALATTTYGRSVLTMADAAALTAALAASTAAGPGIVELATSPETLTGTDATRAVTPAGLQAKIDALINAAPGTLDTLGEIATQLANDESGVAALTTAVAGKQPLDADLTAIAALNSAANQLPYATGPQAWALTTLSPFGRTLIDDADAATARATIDTYSTTQIGDPATDFVAAFNTALA